MNPTVLRGAVLAVGVLLLLLVQSASSLAQSGDVSASPLPLTSSDLSLWHLFWQAHWLVKTVMTGLIVCSVWVWAIAIDKTFLFARMRRATDSFEQAFWSGQSLEDLYATLSAKPTHSSGALFVAAMREWKKSFEGHARSFAGLQMRIEKVMDVAIAREVEHMERWLLVLATVGSAGPFIGLFGTIWGIMTSFQSIAASKNTSLRWWRPASRKRCLRPRLASLPPFQRRFSIISSLLRRTGRPSGSRALPTSFRRSCRGRSTSASDVTGRYGFGAGEINHGGERR